MNNREILFRAKRKDNGEWVEGSLLRSGNGYANIIPVDNSICEDNHGGLCVMKWHEVDPETVCQYTGLKDENGKKIYEGDIVKFKHGGEFSEKGIYYRNYAVEFINTFVTYGLRLRNKNIHFPFKQATASMHDVEVIGNNFDNPELLEGI